jgi:hypothetical protein
MTRRALRPLMWTSAGSPRLAQPARSGGNSSRSVSSSASTTLRGGSCLICRRIRLFFPPQLGVGVQDVARPLPGVVQPAQGAADGVARRHAAGAELKGVLEQGHGPAGVRVAQVLWRAFQQGQKEVLIVLVQQRLATSARLIGKGGGVTAKAVRLDPVVDALAAHAEHPGDVSRCSPVVELQHGQGAPVKENVSGSPELTPQTPPLPGCQLELAHVLLHLRPSSL